MYVQRNTEARSRNNRCRGRAVNITYSACVSVALGVQHARSMHSIILSSVPCPSLQYFPTLSHNGTIFGKIVLEYKV